MYPLHQSCRLENFHSPLGIRFQKYAVSKIDSKYFNLPFYPHTGTKYGRELRYYAGGAQSGQGESKTAIRPFSIIWVEQATASGSRARVKMGRVLSETGRPISSESNIGLYIIQYPARPSKYSESGPNRFPDEFRLQVGTAASCSAPS